MSALESFKKVIKDSIASNKLSSSRVESVKVAAARCFDRAQPAKSEFLRLHYSAPASSKVVSLYLFDAIARHAREIVKKNGAGLDPAKALPSIAGVSDPKASFVRAAKEFLGELATIVEEIVIDTASSVTLEQREKVDKVIDIWRKAATFDANLLDRASLAARKVASASTSSNGNTGNGTYQGRSTTPVHSPPALKRLRLEVNETERGGLATPPVPIATAGLPSNLAALLGAQASAGQSQGPATGSPSLGVGVTLDSTQEFVTSLQNLIGGSTLGPGARQDISALPAFDLSQLTALQQLASSSSSSHPTSGPGASSSVVVQRPHHPGPPPPPPPLLLPQLSQGDPTTNASSFPSTSSISAPIGKLGIDSDSPSLMIAATTTTPPPPTTTTTTTPWPPSADPTSGDLSTFDVLSFDPTRSENWMSVAQRWYNSFGYMPALWEVGMNYLMVYQAALMSQGGYDQNVDMGLSDGLTQNGPSEGYPVRGGDGYGRGGGGGGYEQQQQQQQHHHQQQQ